MSLALLTERSESFSGILLHSKKSTGSLVKNFLNFLRKWLSTEMLSIGLSFTLGDYFQSLIFQANRKMANDYSWGPRENFFWKKQKATSNVITEQHTLHRWVENTSRASDLEEPALKTQNQFLKSKMEEQLNFTF